MLVGPAPHLVVRDGQVGPQQVVRAPHVHPDAAEPVSLDPAALAHDDGHQILGEVEEAVLGDAGEDILVEHVDACVDQVGEDLLLAGLLLELRYPELLVDPGDAELAGVLDGGQGDRDVGFRRDVLLDLGLDVDVGEDVAVGGHEDIVQPGLGELHRSGGAQGLVLVGVDDPDAEVAAVPEDLHRTGLVAAGEDDLLYARASKGPEQVPDARPVRDREDGLWAVLGQGEQPCALPSDHDDGLSDLHWAVGTPFI